MKMLKNSAALSKDGKRVYLFSQFVSIYRSCNAEPHGLLDPVPCAYIDRYLKNFVEYYRKEAGCCNGLLHGAQHFDSSPFGIGRRNLCCSGGLFTALGQRCFADENHEAEVDLKG